MLLHTCSCTKYYCTNTDTDTVLTPWLPVVLFGICSGFALFWLWLRMTARRMEPNNFTVTCWLRSERKSRMSFLAMAATLWEVPSLRHSEIWKSYLALNAICCSTWRVHLWRSLWQSLGQWSPWVLATRTWPSRLHLSTNHWPDLTRLTRLWRWRSVQNYSLLVSQARLPISFTVYTFTGLQFYSFTIRTSSKNPCHPMHSPGYIFLE